MYKWIGSVLVFAGCGGLGLSLAGAHLRRERMLMQICRMLDEMNANFATDSQDCRSCAP